METLEAQAESLEGEAHDKMEAQIDKLQAAIDDVEDQIDEMKSVELLQWKTEMDDVAEAAKRLVALLKNEAYVQPLSATQDLQ